MKNMGQNTIWAILYGFTIVWVKRCERKVKMNPRRILILFTYNLYIYRLFNDD